MRQIYKFRFHFHFLFQENTVLQEDGSFSFLTTLSFPTLPSLSEGEDKAKPFVSAFEEELIVGGATEAEVDDRFRRLGPNPSPAVPAAMPKEVQVLRGSDDREPIAGD